MDVSGKRMYQLLRKLDYERLSTYDGEKKAADIIVEELRSFGAEPTVETFNAPRYDIKNVSFTVTEPFKRQYEVAGYGFSGNAAKDGIEADFYYLESFDPMCLANCKGKIVFCAGMVGVDNYKLLVKSGALALVSTSGTWLDKKSETDLAERMLRPIFMENGVIPCVCMRMADALKLIASGPKKALLTLEQDEYEAPSQNIVAEIKGTKYPDEVVVYTAHYDSVVFSHGMFDNGTGTVTLMEIMRAFMKNPPLRTARFIFTGSEERGLLGSKAYIAAHEDELENIKLCINVDMTGPLLGVDVALVTGEKDICGALNFIKKEMGYFIEVKQDIYSSDAIPFADKGIPGINFLRRAAEGTTGVHTRNDTLSQVDPDALARTTRFIIEISKKVLNAAYFPIERKMPPEMVEKVDTYLRKKKAENK